MKTSFHSLVNPLICWFDTLKFWNCSFEFSHFDHRDPMALYHREYDENENDSNEKFIVDDSYYDVADLKKC